MWFSVLSGGRYINSEIIVLMSDKDISVHMKPKGSVDETDVEIIINNVYRRYLNFMPLEKIRWFLGDSEIDVAIINNSFVVKRQSGVKKQKGFTVLELVVSLAIASVMISGIALMVKSMVHFKGTTDSMQRIKKIEQALEVTYRENVRYVETNCYGWTDSTCANTTILPLPHATDNTKLLLYTYLGTVVRAWYNGAGCSVTGTAPNFVVQCPDGYGRYFTFTGFANTHSLNRLYSNGYNRTPYRVTITSQDNTGITDTWSSGYLDSEYVVYSQKKLSTLADALKSFHLSRLTYEATVNTCDSVNGGLQSYDDVIIPWVWLVQGNSPTQECTGIESGICGCSSLNVTSKWPTSSSYAVTDTIAEFSTILSNLGLNNIYRVDGFGNPVILGLIVDSALTPQVPPRPSVNYNWAIKPPYRGIGGVYSAATGWIYNQRWVYAQ